MKLPPELTRWAWLAFAVSTLFLCLGTRGLNEPDEGRFAEIAREMAAGGEWLVPHLNGFEHFQKPPLLYWLTAASIRCLGANEWAARLPSALAALGVVLLTRQIARRLLGEEAALTTVLILVTSLEFFALARLLTPDMLLTFWIAAAIAALVSGRRWLFFICMGFGFLTKGPMALVVPISAAVAWPRNSGPATPQPGLPWARGLALTLAIGLSWFVVLSLRNSTLFEYFWRYELLERFASSKHGRSKPFWFFLPALIIGFLPWVGFLPFRARELWRAWRGRGLHASERLLIGWLLPPFLILSLSGSKLPTYILPLYPALSLLAAGHPRANALRWRLAIPTACCSLAVTALLPRFNDCLQQQASVRSLADLVRQQPDAASARLFTCEVRAHGFPFYLRQLVTTTRGQADLVLPTNAQQEARLFETPDALENALRKEGPAYGIVRSVRYGETFAPRGWTALGRAGDFVLVGHQAGWGYR